jgi:hypothetical protein
MTHPAQAPDPTPTAAELVHPHRPAVRAKGGRRCGAVPESAGECAAVIGGREAAYPALERAQGFLRLPNGKAVNGFSHSYTSASGPPPCSPNWICSPGRCRQATIRDDDGSFWRIAGCRLTPTSICTTPRHTLVAESGGVLVQHSEPCGLARPASLRPANCAKP